MAAQIHTFNEKLDTSRMSDSFISSSGAISLFSYPNMKLVSTDRGRRKCRINKQFLLRISHGFSDVTLATMAEAQKWLTSFRVHTIIAMLLDEIARRGFYSTTVRPRYCHICLSVRGELIHCRCSSRPYRELDIPVSRVEQSSISVVVSELVLIIIGCMQ